MYQELFLSHSVLPRSKILVISIIGFSIAHFAKPRPRLHFLLQDQDQDWVGKTKIDYARPRSLPVWWYCLVLHLLISDDVNIFKEVNECGILIGRD